MRAMDGTATVSLTGWPIFAVILAGLLLALLVNAAPLALAAGAVLALLFLLLFFGRPDLGMLVALVARASTDLALVYAGQAAAVGGARGTARALVSPNAGLVLILIFAGGLFALSRRVPLLALPGGQPFALLLALGLLGVVRSQDVLLALNEWLPIVAAFVAYGLAAHVFRRPAAIQRAIDALAVSFVLPALLGFYQLATGHASVRVNEAFLRINGTFVHPNAFGLYLALVLAVFACQIPTQKGVRKLLALAITAASSVLLIATFARFAWIGAVIVLLTVGVLRYRTLLALLPLLVAVALAVPSVSARLQNPLGGSFEDRQGIWQALVRAWEARTGTSEGSLVIAVDRLAGLGPGAVDTLTRETYGAPVASHDDYLRVLVEYGLLGLGLYLVLMLVLIISAYRVWRACPPSALSSVALAFLGLTVAYPIMSLTDQVFGATQNQIYFWTLAGLSAAIGRLVRHDDGDRGRRPAAQDDFTASP